MTKKERTIIACKALIDKYRYPHGHKFFTPAVCPLCFVHRDEQNYSCRGCPLASKSGHVGCLNFRTAKAAQKAYHSVTSISEPFPDGMDVPQEFLDRAAFFEKIIPILEKIPKERFTKHWWRYFRELSRDW